MKFTISIDTELGHPYKDSQVIKSRGKQGRYNVNRYLELFQKYEIPATWAILGYLFLDEQYIDEFEISKQIDISTRDYIFAPDIIEKIIESSVNQEIGSHGFQHIDYSKSSKEEIKNDISKSIKALKIFKLTPNSFVFPYNHYNEYSLDQLREHGYKIVRIHHTENPNINIKYSRALFGISSITPVKYLFKLVDFFKKYDIHFHIYIHPQNNKSVWVLEKLLNKIYKEKIQTIPMKDSFDYQFPDVKFKIQTNSNFIFQRGSGLKGIISKLIKGGEMSIYYSNFSNNNILWSPPMLIKTFFKLQRLMHTEEGNLNKGKIILPKNECGHIKPYFIPKYRWKI